MAAEVFGEFNGGAFVDLDDDAKEVTSFGLGFDEDALHPGEGVVDGPVDEAPAVEVDAQATSGEEEVFAVEGEGEAQDKPNRSQAKCPDHGDKGTHLWEMLACNAGESANQNEADACDQKHNTPPPPTSTDDCEGSTISNQLQFHLMSRRITEICAESSLEAYFGTGGYWCCGSVMKTMPVEEDTNHPPWMER